jgi:hypothetical protein
MNPERRTTISGHLVEEFRWLDCPICYVDAHRVSGSFDHAVADLQATSRVLSANRSHLECVAELRHPVVEPPAPLSEVVCCSSGNRSLLPWCFVSPSGAACLGNHTS